MNYQEIEELLYTDHEVLRKMEDTRGLNLKMQQSRKLTIVELQQRPVKEGNRAERETHPNLGSPIPWPMPMHEPSNSGAHPAWQPMTVGQLDIAG